jgi:TolB protein
VRPTWSPDGQQFAVTILVNGNEEVALLNADGSNLRRLTNHVARDLYPTWSPDGRQLVFASDRDGNSEIYTMNLDGSNIRRLTSNAAYDDRPTWAVLPAP